MLTLPQCQTATLGQGSAPRMEQASAPAHSAGLILLWVHNHEKVNQSHQQEHQDSPWLSWQRTSGSDAKPADGSGVYVRRAQQMLSEHSKDFHLLFGGSRYLDAVEFTQARADYLQEQTVLAISGSSGQLPLADNLSIASKSAEKFLEHISN